MRTSRTKTVKRKVVKGKAKSKAKSTPKVKANPKAKMKTMKTKGARPKAAKAKPARKAKSKRPPTRRLPTLVESRKRSDDADAFIRDPGEGPARTRDDLAEVLAEDFIGAATSGNDVLEEDLERETSDELGGPFVVTSARVELADDVDESNPIGAEAEAFPRAVGGGARPSDERDEDDDLESTDERTR